MRIVFAGTPTFAATSLTALLHSKHEVIAVYTQPDRPVGRGQKLTASPVKQLALAHQLPVLQPLSLRETAQQNPLRALDADVMVVIAYGLLLPPAILAIPRLGCINVHASLLPRWRGAAPIQRAILAGDTETGITIMQMDAGLDTGPMLAQAACTIQPTDTSVTLSERLANLGAETLIATLDRLALENIAATPQDSTLACYAAKLQKTEAALNWQDAAMNLERQVRGFNPWPVAYTYVAGQMLKIWQAQALSKEIPAITAPGIILHTSKEGVDVATGSGVLRLLQVQLPNSRQLPIHEVLNAKAAYFTPGTLLGAIN